MVKITGFQQRTNADEKKFIVLELEGSLQFLTSKTSGKLYGSMAKCTIPCTFNEETAKQLVGTLLPGTIEQVPCDPYEYTTPEGEIRTLEYQYSYQEPNKKAPEPVRIANSPVLQLEVD